MPVWIIWKIKTCRSPFTQSVPNPTCPLIFSRPLKSCLLNWQPNIPSLKISGWLLCNQHRVSITWWKKVWKMKNQRTYWRARLCQPHRKASLMLISYWLKMQSWVVNTYLPVTILWFMFLRGSSPKESSDFTSACAIQIIIKGLIITNLTTNTRAKVSKTKIPQNWMPITNTKQYANSSAAVNSETFLSPYFRAVPLITRPASRSSAVSASSTHTYEFILTISRFSAQFPAAKCDSPRKETCSSTWSGFTTSIRSRPSRKKATRSARRRNREAILRSTVNQLVSPTAKGKEYRNKWVEKLLKKSVSKVTIQLILLTAAHWMERAAIKDKENRLIATHNDSIVWY